MLSEGTGAYSFKYSLNNIVIAQLVDHEIDDDQDTESVQVEDHINEGISEFNARVKEYSKGDPLKLVRNLREEYSGIEPIEDKGDESSWYEEFS